MIGFVVMMTLDVVWADAARDGRRNPEVTGCVGEQAMQGNIAGSWHVFAALCFSGH